MARPIPDEAPVTHMVLPAISVIYALLEQLSEGVDQLAGAVDP
jgi:hypothetical protein